MTQHKMIHNHILKAGSITNRTALLEYSIQSFTKRISEMRKAGVNIVGTQKKHPVTNQRYTSYSLA